MLADPYDGLEPIPRLEARVSVIDATLTSLEAELAYQRGLLGAILHLQRWLAVRGGFPAAEIDAVIARSVRRDQKKATDDNDALVDDLLGTDR